jgi:hypothetical protein
VPTSSALGLSDWQTYLISNFNNYNFISGGQTNFQDYYRQMPNNSNNDHTDLYALDGTNSLANYVKTTLDNINSYCNTTTTIQNMNYSNSQTIVGCSLNLQNITIQNNASVIFDASNITTINGPFTMSSGSSLTVK